MPTLDEQNEPAICDPEAFEAARLAYVAVSGCVNNAALMHAVAAVHRCIAGRLREGVYAFGDSPVWTAVANAIDAAGLEGRGISRTDAVLLALASLLEKP